MSKISYVQFKFIKPESEYSEKEYLSIKLKISKNIKYNLNEDASEIFLSLIHILCSI